MANPYLSLTAFKSPGVLNITGTGDDGRLLQLLEAASRQVDGVTRRHFYSVTATMRLPGNGMTWLLLPYDLLAVASLREDTDRDGLYETTWAPSDYVLWPHNADPTGGLDDARPFTAIEVDERSTGARDVFLPGQHMYEIAARWGYWERTEDTGASLSQGPGVTAAVTTLAVDDASLLNTGDTLLIDSEQVYVTGRNPAGNTITVRRGVNGAAAAAHGAGAAIARYLYPGPVVEAVLMQAARLWTRRGDGYAPVASGPGSMAPLFSPDEDVEDMLRPYVKVIL